MYEKVTSQGLPAIVFRSSENPPCLETAASRQERVLRYVPYCTDKTLTEEYARRPDPSE